MLKGRHTKHEHIQIYSDNIIHNEKNAVKLEMFKRNFICVGTECIFSQMIILGFYVHLARSLQFKYDNISLCFLNWSVNIIHVTTQRGDVCVCL